MNFRPRLAGYVLVALGLVVLWGEIIVPAPAWGGSSPFVRRHSFSTTHRPPAALTDTAPLYAPPVFRDASPPISQRPFAQPFIDQGPPVSERPLTPFGAGEPRSAPAFHR
jgi:hypothetical protein